MNTFDFFIAAIVLFALWRGFSAGFVKSFISLVGWLVALIAASRFAGDVGHLFTGMVSSPKLQLALGFLLIVLVSLTVLTIVSMVANKIMETLHIKILDRVAGGVLGALKGILVVLIFMSISAPVIQRLPFWQNSTLVPELMPFAPVAMKLSKDVFTRSIQEITQSQANDTHTTAEHESATPSDGPSMQHDIARSDTDLSDMDMARDNDAAYGD